MGKKKKAKKELQRLRGPVELDKEDEHYVGAVGGLSANVAELSGVIAMLLTILQTKVSDLPQDVALVVDSRVAFYKTQEWTDEAVESGEMNKATADAQQSVFNRGGVPWQPGCIVLHLDLLHVLGLLGWRNGRGIGARMG